jgi:hypothetical protein
MWWSNVDIVERKRILPKYKCPDFLGISYSHSLNPDLEPGFLLIQNSDLDPGL